MVIVSENTMIAAIKLENNLDCKHICETIQKLINWHNKYEPIESDSVLIIKIEKIIDSNISPKNIEYKN